MSSLADARLAFIGLRSAIAQLMFQVPTTSADTKAAIELARMLRRLLQLALNAARRELRSATTALASGLLRNEGSECFVVVKQSVAPCLGPLLQQ